MLSIISYLIKIICGRMLPAYRSVTVGKAVEPMSWYADHP
jgi:hypothetical protein